MHITICFDRDAIRTWLKAKDGFARSNFGAMLCGQRQLRIDTGFRADEPRFRFEITDLVIANVELGIARADLRSIQQLMGNAMRPRRSHRILEESFDMDRRLAVPAGDNQFAALGEKIGAGFALDVAPDFVAAFYQGRVVCTLADGEPGNARVAVTGALFMRRGKAIDAQHPHATLGELIERGASHRAQADNDDVVAAQPRSGSFRPGRSLSQIMDIIRQRPSSPRQNWMALIPRRSGFVSSGAVRASYRLHASAMLPNTRMRRPISTSKKSFWAKKSFVSDE